MLLHLPEPGYNDSDRAQGNFRLALKVSLYFVALLWVVTLLDWGLEMELTRFGVRPRSLPGLPGVLVAPLLHGDFSHLISNSLPLLVLGTGMLYLYPHSSLKVIPAVYLGPGLAVWLFGRPPLHIGASGLVYGLAIYILISGIIRRDTRAVSAAMLVFFLYGTLLWGLLPNHSSISWETHLIAALIGLVLALLFRRLDVPLRKRYDWENESDDDNDQPVN
jgi:membrane associated rhomboid family serine protease